MTCETPLAGWRRETDKVAKGLLPASRLYQNQNDAGAVVGNSVHYGNRAGAGCRGRGGVRHCRRAVIARNGPDTDPIFQEKRRALVYFFGRPTRLRLGERLAAGLALLRVKLPQTMNAVGDHYEQIGVMRVSDIDPPLNQTGRPLALRPGTGIRRSGQAAWIGP